MEIFKPRLKLLAIRQAWLSGFALQARARLQSVVVCRGLGEIPPVGRKIVTVFTRASGLEDTRTD